MSFLLLPFQPCPLATPWMFRLKCGPLGALFPVAVAIPTLAAAMAAPMVIDRSIRRMAPSMYRTGRQDANASGTGMSGGRRCGVLVGIRLEARPAIAAGSTRVLVTHATTKGPIRGH